MAGFLTTVKEWFSGAPSPEEQAHIDAVAADPDNDEPRLAYAAWLSDNGDPRGEFLRGECERAKLDEGDPRRDELESQFYRLLDEHGKKWVKPLKELELEPKFGRWFVPNQWFDRGMIENMTVTKRGIIPGKAERLWQLAPAIRRLKFERCSPDWDGIAGCPEMQRVVQLDLSEDLKIDASDLQDLLGSPHLANIQVLELGGKRFGVRLVEAITGSSLTDLRKLHLGRCDLDHDAITKLLAWEGLQNLEALSLLGNDLKADSVRAVVTCPRLTKLQSLNLSNNYFGPEGAAPLSEAQLPRLNELKLESNSLEAAGLASLLQSNLGGRLRRLDLDSNNIGDDGLTQLAASNLLAGVTHLHLCSHGGTLEGIRAVLTSPQLGELLQLHIAHGEIGAEGAELLAGCDKLTHLRKLNCYGIECGDEWEAKLKEQFGEDVVEM